MDGYLQSDGPEPMGKIPIMVLSRTCHLYQLSDRSLADLGECIYDQGGYFIINGSEKVVIAQERMSSNDVYCFRKKQPHKFSWVCETRSHVEGSGRPTSTMYLQLYGADRKQANKIAATIPHIRDEVPVVIIFRALGFLSDKDILSHIVYDFKDEEMLNKFRASLEEVSFFFSRL